MSPVMASYHNRWSINSSHRTDTYRSMSACIYRERERERGRVIEKVKGWNRTLTKKYSKRQTTLHKENKTKIQNEIVTPHPLLDPRSLVPRHLHPWSLKKKKINIQLQIKHVTKKKKKKVIGKKCNQWEYELRR